MTDGVLFVIAIALCMAICAYFGYDRGKTNGKEEGKEEFRRDVEGILRKNSFIPASMEVKGICMAVEAVDEVAQAVGINMHNGLYE